MRIFKLIDFARWAKKEKIADASLKAAVSELEAGLYGVKLGAHLFKQRVPSAGKGKRGGARAVLAYQEGDKVFFMYGYKKNQKANISEREKESLKKMAKMYMEYDADQLLEAEKIKDIVELV